MSAWRIRELIGDRVITPTEVMEHFLARIEELEPSVHAFYSIDVESTRAQAAEATRAVAAGEPLGPLHGIPPAAIDLRLVKGDRKRVVSGQSVSARVDPGVRRPIQTKPQTPSQHS